MGKPHFNSKRVESVQEMSVSPLRVGSRQAQMFLMDTVSVDHSYDREVYQVSGRNSSMPMYGTQLRLHVNSRY